MKREIIAKLRKRINSMNHVFQRYVEDLKKLYPRSTIILYGSRARGDHLPYSDYDLLVVLEKVNDKLSETIRARSIKPMELPLDLIVISIDELDDPLLLGALRKGYRILYDELRVSGKIKEKLERL